MATMPWINSGVLIVDSGGKPILCETCPCTAACCLYPMTGNFNPSLGQGYNPITDYPTLTADIQAGTFVGDLIPFAIASGDPPPPWGNPGYAFSDTGDIGGSVFIYTSYVTAFYPSWAFTWRNDATYFPDPLGTSQCACAGPFITAGSQQVPPAWPPYFDPDNPLIRIKDKFSDFYSAGTDSISRNKLASVCDWTGSRAAGGTWHTAMVQTPTIFHWILYTAGLSTNKTYSKLYTGGQNQSTPTGNYTNDSDPTDIVTIS